MLPAGAALAVVAIIVMSCAKDKYAEVRTLLNDYITMTGDLDKAIDSAKSGKEVAVALRAYIAKVKVLGPQVESLPEKYPELENDPPADLKELIASFESATSGMGQVFGKLMAYMEDEAVVEALEELEETE
jgi:hypothetical protein